MDRSIATAVLVRGACLFGSWTLFCYAMILTKSGFDALSTWSVVPLIVGLALGSLCMGGPESINADRLLHAGRSLPTGGNHWGIISALLAIALLAFTLRLVGAAWWSVWAALLSGTALAFWRVSRAGVEPGDTSVPMLMNPQRIAVVALVICGAILVAIAHRTDPDDAQYLNFVVTAIDFPSEPLFSRSGLWQDNNAPLELSLSLIHI